MPPEKFPREKLDSHWQQLERGEAKAVAAELAEKQFVEAPPLMLRGLAHLDAGDAKAAETNLRQVLHLQPDNPIAANHLALAVFLQGGRAEAAKAFRQAPVMPSPRFLERFVRIFWPLRFTTDIARSKSEDQPPPQSIPHEAKYQSALQAGGMKKRRVAATLKRRATKEFFKPGRRYVAEILLQRSHELNPGDVTTAGYLAHLRLMHGKTEEALGIVEPHVEESLNRYQETRSTADLPRYEFLAGYAFCLHEAGQHREAIQVLTAVEPQGPYDHLAYFISSVCWLELGNMENFRRAFAMATGPFFLDTWELVLQPFTHETIEWLEESSTEQKV